MTFDLDSYFSILVLLLVSSVKFPFYFLELMAMLNPLKPSVPTVTLRTFDAIQA